MADVERVLLTGALPPVVLCLSHYVRRAFRSHYALDDAHSPILFNGVDLNRFEPAPRPHGDTVKALFIGQDDERKGLREAMIASETADPRLELLVVGKERLAPMSRRQHFVGEVSDPRPFYRQADFFVLPTKHDPCSLVVLEALAMGVPVISTRFNGACEIMTDGVHGFVLDDPTDVNALAEAMRKMLDPALRARMSAACLELRPRLSYENHLRNLLGIYERIVQSRRS